MSISTREFFTRLTFLIAFFIIISFSGIAQIQQDKSLELPAFVVFPEKINVYDIKSQPPFIDEDKTYVFKSVTSLPSGLEFPETGILAWFPTPGEYEQILQSDISIAFEAREKTGDSVVTGTVKILGKGKKKDNIRTVSVDTISVPSDSIVQEKLTIKLPEFKGWSEKSEGEVFSFKVGATGGVGEYVFNVSTKDSIGFTFENNGYFYWEPDYDFVNVDNTIRGSRFKFSVLDEEGNRDSATVDLKVHNTNRTPVVNELPTFYVQYDKENVYQLKLEGIIYDKDEDPIEFKPVLSDMPQGMTLSKDGEIRWKPSVSQFNQLRREPMKVSFIVEDIPYEDETTGIARFEVTQQDLPPQITMVPTKESIEIDENEALNLGFFLNDPNGQEDIAVFDFVSDNEAVDKSSLQLVNAMQYEFKWTPDFNFVKERGKSEEFEITFYAFDKENNRTEKQLKVKVNNAENIEELDRMLYLQYRTVLATAMELVEQLSEKEEELKKEYKQAKKGKKNRAISNASLGAVTGLSPIFLEGQTQKVTVGIGGTATATIGTLEASNVIGNPPSDIMQKWTYVTQKKNEILLHGNIFAGKYAQKEERRKGGFQNDLKNLTLQMNLQDMTKLELDATWESSKEASDKNIKKVFKDFYPDEEYSVD